MLRKLGAEVTDFGIIPDQLEATRKAFAEAAAHNDWVISSGGVSVGDADFVKPVLQELGDITFWKIAIKPGRPLALAMFNGTPVVGLPGNPASTLVTFGLLARPYMLRRLGVQRVEPLGFAVPAGFTWGKPGMRREYLRARLEHGRVVPYANQSSGVLRSAAWAEGLAAPWST